MKFTLSWLKAHLETDATVEAIAEKLTALGLEVEGIEDRAQALAPFVIGYVKSAEKHPDADRLRVCVVDTGSGDVQVICGAPNARAGMKGVFAPVGSHIPGTGLDLKAGVIRGVQSNGMLCSEREMGLSDEHQGIIELPDDAPVGQPFAAYAGLADPLIEISLTPDRADCAGVRGIARDLAAAGLGRLKPIDTTPVPGRFKSPIAVHLDFPTEAGEPCPLFVGRTIRGVSNGPSPRWLQERLRAIGLRPISALVDVTNFFTYDQARPLHVFDADLVQGDLTLTLSEGGEILEALNDKTYTLDEGMTLISDASGPVSLAGVVGGVSTGCTEATKSVFLEAALFDPIRTAMTGRKLQVQSDARYRFERGVDPAAVFDAVEQATRMIIELCGGEPSEVVHAGHVLTWRRSLSLRRNRVASLGGVEVPTETQVRILSDLGFSVDASGPDLVVEPPSWRGDVHGEADLVEEVLRVHGFDRIPAEPLPRTATITRPAVTPSIRSSRLVRRALAQQGLDEAVTWSFMDHDKAARFGLQHRGLELLNPIASDLSTMRPSILPNLIDAARRNAARGYPDVGLFEVGPAYSNPSDSGQALVAAVVRAGRANPRHWAAANRPVDAFDAKADALAALEAIGAPVANLIVTTDVPDWYHPGRSGCLRLGPTVLAQFGEIHPSVLAAMDAAAPVVAAEVFLDRVPQPKKRPGPARPALKLSPLQPVSRDFAVVVAEDIPSEKVVKAARGADKALIADVSLFDVYRGPGLPEGHKSLAIEVVLQPVEQTLTEGEIDAVGKKVVAAIEKIGGRLRG